MKNKLFPYLSSKKFDKHLAYTLLGTLAIIIVMALLFGIALLMSFFNTLKGVDASFDKVFYFSSLRILIIMLVIEHVVCGIKFMFYQIKNGTLFKKSK